MRTTEHTDQLGVVSLLEAAGRLQERVDSALDALGLSMSKYMTLQYLVSAGGAMSLSSLANCRKCVRSNITQLVDRLVLDGLVERVNDPSDRRTVLAQVTRLGNEKFEAGSSAMQGVQEEFMGHVSAEDRANFAKVLSAFGS
jgi:DNA-binding MarR family transcriptional regulator